MSSSMLQEICNPVPERCFLSHFCSNIWHNWYNFEYEYTKQRKTAMKLHLITALPYLFWSEHQNLLKCSYYPHSADTKTGACRGFQSGTESLSPTNLKWQKIPHHSEKLYDKITLLQALSSVRNTGMGPKSPIPTNSSASASHTGIAAVTTGLQPDLLGSMAAI